jgi:hypothetical protein
MSVWTRDRQLHEAMFGQHVKSDVAIGTVHLTIHIMIKTKMSYFGSTDWFIAEDV